MIDYSFSIYELEYYLLIFTRVTGFIFACPFFSMNNTPRRVRITLGVFLSYLLYQAIYPHEVIQYDSLLGYSAIVMKEAMTGILIGLSTSMCNSIVLFAGRLIDMEIGLAMASEYDPTTKENASVTGIFYQYLVMLILMISNLHHYLIKALAETYTLIPINGAIFSGGKIVSAFVSFMSGYINIGFRICLPIFCVLLITNCILGIMAKVAPQMNMFAVGMQIKLLMGLGVLFLTVGMLPHISDFVFTEMKTVMVSFVEAIMA